MPTFLGEVVQQQGASAGARRSFDESAFRRWYRAIASRTGLHPDPDHTAHRYDYRAAYRAGVSGPELDRQSKEWHWPSEFKADDHPRRFVKAENGRTIDSKTGTPVQQATTFLGDVVGRHEETPPEPSLVDRFRSTAAAVGIAGEVARRGLTAAAGRVKDAVLDAARDDIGDFTDDVKAGGRAFVRGSARMVRDLAVNAPNALYDFGEHHTPEFVPSSPEEWDDGDWRTYRRMRQNLKEGWDDPIREVTAKVEEAFAATPEEQAPFLEQLKRDPRRALAAGAAESLPSLLAVIGAGVANPVAGLAVVGASEGGAAYEEALAQGAPPEEASKAAGLTALPNMVLEYLPAGRLIKRVFRGVPEAQASSVIRSILTQALSEGATETLQELNASLAALITYAGEQGFTWNDFVELVSDPENLDRYAAGLVLGGTVGAGAGTLPTKRVEATAPQAPQPSQEPTDEDLVASQFPTLEDWLASHHGLELGWDVIPDKLRAAFIEAEHQHELARMAAQERLQRRRSRASQGEPPPQAPAPAPRAEPAAEEAAPPPAAVPQAESAPLAEAVAEPEPRASLGEPTPSTQPVGRPAAQVFEVPTEALHVDPERFQFKLIHSDEGLTGSLSDARQYDPQLAGIVQVWQDPADQRLYVVNGHNRVGLARRTGHPTVLARLIEAGSAQEARAVGALTNIAEGRGTAVDAGKFLRDAALGPDELRARGLAMTERIASDGVALASLTQPLFSAVARGEYPLERGVIIGRKLKDHSQQLALVRLLDQQERRGRRLTNPVVEELADMVAGAPSRVEQQQTLFGTDERHQTVAIEKAEILADIRRRLQQERRLFGLVSRTKNAEELASAGNVINLEGNQAISTEAAQILEVFDKLKTRAPLAGLLDEAALRVADGEGASHVRQEVYGRVREAVREVVAGSQGAGSQRSGLDGPVGLSEAGLERGAEPTRFGAGGGSAAEPSLFGDADLPGRGGRGRRGRAARGVDADRSAAAAPSPGPPAPPPFTPTSPRTPQRAVDTQPARLPLELPEIVELAQELGRGALPRVRRSLAGAWGRFSMSPGAPRSGRIDVLAELAADPGQAARTLAHEVGHWVDSLPEATRSRGNILGSLASLKRYLKSMIDELPTTPSAVLAPIEMRKLRQVALREARRELGKGHPEIARRARELYVEAVEAEMRRRRLVDKKTVLEELWALSTSWRPLGSNPDPAYLAYRRSNRELYADAFSVLLNDPELAKRQAPTFHSLFFNYLDSKAEVRDAYEQIQARIERGPEAVLDHRLERYTSMVERGGLERARVLTTPPERGTLREELVDGLIDRASVLYRAVRQARKKGLEFSPDENPLYWVEEMSYHVARASEYLYRFKAEVLDPVRQAGISDVDFGALLGLRRAGEGDRRSMFNPLGEQGRFAEELLAHLEAKLGADKARAAQEAARRWWTLREEVLSEVEASRAYSPRAVKRMKSNPEYVKFFVRHYIERDAAYGKALGGLHEQIGTLEEIGNPVVETVLTDLALLRTAHRTQTARVIVNFYKKAFPGDIESAKRGPGGRILETRQPRRGTLFYLDDGTVKAVYLPARVTRLMEHDLHAAGAAYRTYNFFSRPMRELLVGVNWAWALWNIQRDYKSFRKNVVRGRNPLTVQLRTLQYYAKAVPDAARDLVGVRTETVERMYRGRMLIQGGESFRAAGDLTEADALNAVLTRAGVLPQREARWTLRVLRRISAVLHAPGQFSERLGKIAGYKYLREQHPEMSEREIAHRVRTLVGTPDVMRRGDWYKFTNSFFLFSNVSKEGWRASWEAARESPSEYVLKVLAFDLAPKLVMIAAAYGLFGEELEELFGKISEYDKANFLIIPVGLTPSGKAVFLRMPQDHAGQFIGGLAWRLARGGHITPSDLFEFVNQNVPYSLGNLHPYMEGALAANTYLEGHNPQDRYTGQPMISQRVFEAGGPRKWAAFGRGMAETLGLDILIPFDNEDPAAITTRLEELLGTPGLGNILKRVVKVSAYGEVERAEEATQEVRSQAAERSLALDELVRESLLENPDATVGEVFREARARGLDPGKLRHFKERVIRLRARMYGDNLERALSHARSKAEREVITEQFEAE